MIFTCFKARCVILKRLPPHDQVETLRRFDPLREQVALITLCAAE
jgi:hypothetical protein